ncbi:MAG: hypothetical protein U0S50_16445 [Sphingopyxis sp.]|uniref:hypothetical protein n=1 Tax=Sphingopyxis sp. TaxID=1908224 RepID=UPI002AB9E858|nr:hypothetical protein [Sphingopyxis sp.]MDZ3833383.1 hypothetical protein [Sphingopyxis sp.]
MMKNIPFIAAAAAFFSLTPAVAMAQSTVSGTVTVQKGTGPLLTCTATIGLNGSSPSTSTQVTSMSLTGGTLGLCATVQFPNVPHSITQGGGAFQVNDVFADTTITAGDCRGNLTGTISGGVITINDILEEVDAGTGDCTIDGSVS